MDKKLTQTLFITFLFLMGYSILMSTIAPKKQPSSSPTPLQTEIVSKPVAEPVFPAKESQISTVTIGDFIVTYSPQGGYIKKIILKANQEEFLYQDIGFVQSENSQEFSFSIQNDRIIFNSRQGSKKEFIVGKDRLKIILSPAPSDLIVFSNSLSNNSLDHGYQEIFFFEGSEMKRKNLNGIIKGKTDLILKNIKYTGARDRYFCASLLPGNYNAHWKKTNHRAYLMLSSPPAEISLYLGPQMEKNLKNAGLSEVINYGFFHSIGSGLAWLLNIFYGFTKSWGLSIILFSLFVYALLFPFTMKSTKAMKKMAAIQPEIDELKKKCKDNPQKLNKEIIELYKKNKINPLGGCLPLLLQLPVFIALYQVLLRFVELKGASFLWIKDLSLPDHAVKLPFPAPLDYLNILPIIIAILGLIQQKMTTISSAAKEQKSMGLIFSVFMGVIFYNFPASLTLYWFIQNFLTLIYQTRITVKPQTAGN